MLGSPAHRALHCSVFKHSDGEVKTLTVSCLFLELKGKLLALFHVFLRTDQVSATFTVKMPYSFRVCCVCYVVSESNYGPLKTV